MAALGQPQPGPCPTVYISFSAEINAHTTESLIAVFANEINQGKRDFYLMISIPGGSVMNGLNLYNVLRGLPITLTRTTLGTWIPSEMQFSWLVTPAMHARIRLSCFTALRSISQEP